MNGTEQRARHNAVANAERRIADLELVVVKLSEEILAERETFATHLLKQHETCQTRWEGTTEATQHVDDRVEAGREATRQALTEVDRQFQATRERHIGLAEAFLKFEHQTFWQRLYWLVGGV